jgi:hypothetical protein
MIHHVAGYVTCKLHIITKIHHDFRVGVGVGSIVFEKPIYRIYWHYSI